MIWSLCHPFNLLLPLSPLCSLSCSHTDPSTLPQTCQHSPTSGTVFVSPLPGIPIPQIAECLTSSPPSSSTSTFPDCPMTTETIPSLCCPSSSTSYSPACHIFSLWHLTLSDIHCTSDLPDHLLPLKCKHHRSRAFAAFPAVFLAIIQHTVEGQ